MKPIKKKIQHFNNEKYSTELAAAFSNRKEAKELNEALKSFPDCEGMEQIERFLSAKTGFVNVQMSASAMGLEKEYKTIMDYLGVIDLENYNADFTQLTDGFIDTLRETHTIYWSDADAKFMDKIDKHLKSINELEISHLIGYDNNKKELVFNEKHWNVMRQLDRPRIQDAFSEGCKGV